MTRTTIDYGIDLGTTNSAVAVLDDALVTVVKNNDDQREYTPSAVFVSKSGKIYVGERAKQRIVSDPGNACAEFKLRMGGRGWHKTFEASGRTMTPEQLSSEVLKSLRGDVQVRSDEMISSAVITVPAAFELDQCDATRQAASLAGFTFAPLLQEPTAAAWAYSASEPPQRAFWLVYDFGGGTFDAAVIKLADGEFTVVNHAGDNFLGGKLIDWSIVDELFIPAVRRELGLTTLTRADPECAGVIAKLKAAAETAKIELSRQDSTEIDIELADDQYFSYELRRADVERLAMPLYAKSVVLCKKALAEKNLRPGDIERVLLVGGTTLAPALRELLADPREGLGIPLDHSQDPITVVARGAAMYAGTQRLPSRSKTVAPGRIGLDLQYKPVGSDPEPLVGGRVESERARDWTGYSVEFVLQSVRGALNGWRSGQVTLTAEGTFATRLQAQERSTNDYAIEFRDAQGTLLKTDPDILTYRHLAMVGGNAVLSHSIGVWLDGNEVEWLVRKGTEVPARGRLALQSTVDVRKDGWTGLIRVPIVEGERYRADRDTLIGRLDIRPDQIRRDVPAGSEIEVTLRIDESFLPTADAYIPVLDEEFDIQLELGRAEAPDAAELRQRGEAMADRYAELREESVQLEATEAFEALDRFATDGHIDAVRRLAGQTEVDPDAAPTCQARLRDAEAALDAVEEKLEIARITEEARDSLTSVWELVRTYGNQQDKRDFEAAEAAVNEAIEEGDRTVVHRRVETLWALARRVLDSANVRHIVLFEILEQQLDDHPGPEVQRLLAQGRKYRDAGNDRGLRPVIERLRPHVPGQSLDVLDPDTTVTRG